MGRGWCAWERAGGSDAGKHMRCDAGLRRVNGRRGERAGDTIRCDMQVRVYVGSRWSPALVACCRSIVDMSTVDCAIRPVQVVGGDRHRHSLATDVGGITWGGGGGGSGGGQGCGCRRAITTIAANPSWTAGRTMDATRVATTATCPRRRKWSVSGWTGMDGNSG